MKLPDFTLGIEEEFMVIDPETRELKSHVSEMISAQDHVGLVDGRAFVRCALEAWLVGHPGLAEGTDPGG